jgi:protein SCO1/2
MKNKFLYILIITLLFSHQTIVPDESKIDVGIDEQLGSFIPLDVHFNDADGNDVRIKELISDTKATVLAFVYYKCPAICSPLLFEIADVVNRSDMELGYDYNIISISMDEFETPEIAADKRKSFLSALDRKAPDNANWR